jgi:aspartate beta-hydroxylase
MIDTRVTQIFAAAMAEQRGGRNEAAVQLLEQVIGLVPDHPQALNSLGTQYLARGEIEKARDCFRRAAAADPDQPVLWLNVARAERELGDAEGERSALDRVLAIDARHFAALLRKAHLAQRTGRDSEAAVLWQQVAAIAPPPAQLTPEVRALLEQGIAFAEHFRLDFGGRIDAGLADARAALAPSARRRVDAAIDTMLGRRRIYTNVCDGLHIPFLPADEFFERSHFPWLERLEAATAAVQAELASLLEVGHQGFAPYVQYPSGYPESKWSELDHSERWSAFFLWRHGARIDDHCARCPATAALLQSLPLADHAGRAPTAFFSLLHPRTRIPPHTGVTNARTIVHLPLIVPPGCGFRVGGEIREWQVGTAFAFDDTIEHEAWNDSDALRAVLIFDVWNPYLRAEERALINGFFDAAGAAGLSVATFEG